MSKKLPLTHALFWIVGSTFLITGGGYKGLKYYNQKQRQLELSYISRILQTGPQRTPLHTVYLAELMGISADHPTSAAHFDPKAAEKKIVASPVIKEAHVKLVDSTTIYVDYAVRKPLAWLSDFDNTAIDEEGIPFPIAPFFTPKSLPEVYLGVSRIAYHAPLQGKEIALALSILKLSFDFSIRRLDLSKAAAPSLGRREIVLLIEDGGFPRYLRLTPKNYLQELGNYLELRSTLPPQPHIVDLRIPQLGFISDLN